MSCEDPPTPTNGYYIVKHLEPRKMIRYSCNLGYDLNGTESSACIQGVWSSPSPDCRIIRCSKPTVPDNGQVEFSDTTANSTAVYSCKKGYFVEGGKVSMCRPLVKGNGAAWDIRTCTPIQCRAPTAPSNGGFTGDMFHYPNTIRFHCEKGYTLMGNSGVQCNSKGNWVTVETQFGLSFPTCEPKDCGPPDEIEHGQVSGKYFHFPGRVNFTCELGFCLSGPTTSQCNATGSWSPSAPKCSTVMCPALPALSHGTTTTSSSKLTVGMVATYACNRGYDLNGRKREMNIYKRKCIQNHATSDCEGEWTEDDPQCIAKKCEVPERPTNGSIVGAAFFFPNNITFRCQEGYVIQGDAKFHCNHQGKWIAEGTTKFPTCKPKSCGKPSKLDNGMTSASNNHYPSTITYSCKEGFCFNGTSSAICDATGSWTKEFRDCKRVWCRNLNHPNHGEVILPLKRWTGEVARYKCNSGYVLSGTAVISCVQSNNARVCRGTWSQSAPTCKPIECDPFDSNGFLNGTVTGDKFYYPEIIIFKCNSGHTLQGGGPQWMCSEKGTWIDKKSNGTGVFPSCQPRFCGPPIAFENGIARGKLFHFPGKVNFTCKPRFCIQGPTRSRCNETGLWSSVTPKCSPVLCPELHSPRHGALKTSSSAMTVGLVATYTCNVGYELNGKADINEYNRTCTQSQTITDCIGQWTGVFPECVAKRCDDPVIPRNGSVIGKKFIYPNSITFQCERGFDIFGEVEFHCGYKGKWVSVASPDGKLEFPSCDAKDCRLPPKLEHGQSIGRNYNFPGKISYTCNKGFCLIGNSSASCLSTGSWSEELRKCERVVCRNLNHPENGTVNVPKKRWVGKVANYTCDQGFVFNGHPSTTCEQSPDQRDCHGIWSKSVPVCKPKTCQKFEATKFTNGSVNSTKFYYPEVVRFKCISGHRLQGGGPHWQCRYDGTWIDKANNKSGPFPTCEPKDCGVPTVPQNCSITGKYFQYPGIVHFTRYRGYCVDGATETKCTNSGNWSEGSTNCKPIKCRKNTGLLNGKIMTRSGWPQKGRFVDDSVHYICNLGYDLNMNRTLLNYSRTCMQNDNIRNCRGRWSGKEPCCIPRSCPDPHASNFQNGTIVGSAFFYPEIIGLNCFAGHELNGDGPLFQCSDTGDWVTIRNVSVDYERENEQRIRRQLKHVKACLKEDKIVTQPQMNSIPIFPSCKPKNCGQPHIDDNCTSTGKYFHYPGVINVSRKYGFCVHGASVLQCNSAGVWSSKPPTCKRILCPALERPIHGNLSYSYGHREVGDKAIYTCEDGYDLNMDRNLHNFTRQCKQSSNAHQCVGKWEKKSPCCIPRSCPDAHSSDFLNGTIKGKAYFYPQIIELNCILGHELLGGESAFQCNQRGIWEEIDKRPTQDLWESAMREQQKELKRANECLGSDEIRTKPNDHRKLNLPNCQPKNCKSPKVNAPCSSIGNYFQYPGIVQFGRVRGDCVVGAKSTECTSDGKWSEISPTCKQIRCPLMEVPRNGMIQLKRPERYVDSTAVYTCNSGYDLFMDSRISEYRRSCEQFRDIHQCEGFWRKANPCCIPRSCQDLSNFNFENGTIIGKNYFFPEIITLKCNVGHILSSGGPRYMCSETGSWVHIENPPRVDYDVVAARLKYEIEQMKTCLHITEQKVSIVTLGKEPESVEFPRCGPVECGKPDVDEKGGIDYDCSYYRCIATFSCNTGFCMRGAKRIQCLASGQWSHESPKCERVICPKLKNDSCMYHKPPPKRYVGESAIYYPYPGFYTVGQRNTTCQQYPDSRNCKGYWENPPPRTEAKDCGHPPRLVNGISAVMCTTYLREIPHSCNDGYEVKHGTLAVNSTTQLCEIRYSCNEGYEMKDGDSVRKCLTTGVWSGFHPRCQHVCADAKATGSYAQNCVVKGGKSSFTCLGKSQCPSDYTPVCASNTKTYNNRCLMKLAGCESDRKNDTIEVARLGQCSFGGICSDPKPKPPPGVTCRGFLYRYYHNSESGVCERYVHGSCFEGHNKFYTMEDCKETCLNSNPCFLDVDNGSCGLTQERFYYNITHESCVKFTYTGCFGNENNFRSKEKCEMKCNGTRITPTVVTMSPEDCCPAVFKKRCNADLVLDMEVNSLRVGTNRVKLSVKSAPKNLKGKGVNKYRFVKTLSVPRHDSGVGGCSLKCPKLSSDSKYLALVRDVRHEKSVLSTDKYHFIPYSSGEKTRLLGELKRCRK